MSSTGSRWRDIARVFSLLRAEMDRHLVVLGVGTVLMVVVGGALSALSPLVLKSLVDIVTLPSDAQHSALRPSIWPFGAEYVLLLLAGRVLGDIRPLLSGTLNQRLHSRLTRRFFDHVTRLPMRYLLERRSGELLHSLDLASAGAQLVISHLATSLLPVLVELVTMTAVLIHLDQPSLIGVFAAVALAYLVIFSAGAPRMTMAAHGVSAASVELHAQLGDSLAHLETLRCFTAEPQAGHRLAQANAVLERRWLTLNRLNLAISLAATIVFALSMSACLIIGASAVSKGAMTVGGFVLATVYMLQMVRPLESLGSAARDSARALGYLRPLLDLLSEPVTRGALVLPEDDPTAATMHRSAPTVRVENLHFAYDPDRPVLKGVDFEVPAGSTTAIVGCSGSGKSSLARLLMRLYEPQSGRILLDDSPIDLIAAGELRRHHIGLVPQETSLMHDTIAGNVALGLPEASRADVHRMACAAQLEGLLDALPLGLDTPVGERGMQLSGGERQRVGIARALLRRPGLYVLDEPTSMLDTRTEVDILKALRSLSKGATMIVIAHRLSTIVNADEIVVLADGRVGERGSHLALLAKNGLYAEMWRRQVAGSS